MHLYHFSFLGFELTSNSHCSKFQRALTTGSLIDLRLNKNIWKMIVEDQGTKNAPKSIVRSSLKIVRGKYFRLTSFKKIWLKSFVNPRIWLFIRSLNEFRASMEWFRPKLVLSRNSDKMTLENPLHSLSKNPSKVKPSDYGLKTLDSMNSKK